MLKWILVFVFLGFMNVIPLSEGSFTVDKSKLFVPFDDDHHDLKQRPVGSLLVEIQPFIVITPKDILLLDTGLGFETDGKLQIHKNLADAGINPSDVTKVLITHLHKDHAGGISYGTNHEQLSFPEATYYLQQRELKNAIENGFPSFIPDELKVLENSEQIVYLKDDEGMIDDYIHYKITGAHSPYHQAFWIKEDEQTIFFGGDEAPQLQQMKHRFIAKYDFNGKKAMELRRQWWQQGQQEHWTFLFYHDVKNPVVKF